MNTVLKYIWRFNSHNNPNQCLNMQEKQTKNKTKKKFKVNLINFKGFFVKLKRTGDTGEE